ncbi:uncharacterized protein DNG_06020 [Cephalotrichum gorgonifer]|uniref:Uncharacterized protein n=1 Tax=Cephalotrichum gorgonifer TaxID=2041049 RepID=A0AAE8N1G6_9PEZI|nr:uncharacterized protein DNG_06020 [Cephalotrichum gorgonifer]
MLSTLARRTAFTAAAAPKRPPLTVFTNPYQPKKVWPPDYAQLSFQEQLRFEKKYKRRVMLACARPRWDKGVKLAQLVTVVGVVGWLVFFSELEFYGKSYKPSEEIGKSVGTIFGIFSEENRYDRNPDGLNTNTEPRKPNPRG